MLDLLFPATKRRADYAGDGFLGFGLWGPGMFGSMKTKANVVVGQDTALTLAACWRATQILSSTVAGLPLETFYHLPGGNKELARDQSIYSILRDCPNPDMDAMTFREGRTVHQINWGNGFAEIERTRKGDGIAALWPIHPSRVWPIRREDKDPETGRPLLPTYRYRVRNNDGSHVYLRADEMLHVPGSHSDDGIWGKGVVAHARESIGMGLATERHGATYFGNGAQPPAVLFLPGMKDSEARKGFRSEWRQVHGSPDSGEIAILPPEGRYEKLSYPPEDSQFIETRVHNVREISRWYGIPSHMLGDLEKASYNSIEQLGIEFVTFSLLQWLKRWEGQICLKLLNKEQRRRIFVQHDISHLVRGDLKTLYECCQIGLMNGFLCINDVRRLLNLNSIGPLGDKYRVQLNTTTLEMAGLPAPPKTININDGSGKTAPAPAAPETPAGTTPDSLLDVPDVRQSTDYSCGPCAVLSVAQYFGVDEGKTEEDMIKELDTEPTSIEDNGTDPARMVNWLTNAGLTVTSGAGWTVDDLRHYWAAGQPVIVPIQDYGTPEEYRENQSGHYVVVIGLGFGYVFVQDPSADNVESGDIHTADTEGQPFKPVDSDMAPGRVMIPEETFLAVWHDMEDGGKIDIQYGIAVGRGHAPPPPPNTAPATPAPLDDGKEPQPTPGPADSDSRDRGTKTTEARAAARSVLEATLVRLLAKEANAAIRAIDRPDFEDWLAEFHVKHEQIATEALTPVIPVLGLAGVEMAAGKLAKSLIDNSRTALLAAYNLCTKQQMKDQLGKWTSQAPLWSGNVLKG